jgi:FkbM family methyltransferase
MSFARQVLSHTPLLAELVATLTAPPRRRTPSDWLYQHVVLDWLYRPELRRQLPWPFRMLALWCAAQRPLGGYIAGARRMRRWAAALTRRLRLPQQVMLDLGHASIGLDLLDPRMLAVPRELLEDGVERRMLRSLVRPGDSFVDVGANHGSFCVMAAPLLGPSGRIVAIEPQPRLAALLRRTLAANLPADRWNVLEIACADRAGQALFYQPLQTSGRAGLVAGYSADGDHESFTVPIAPFDQAVDWALLPGRIVLKLDIEGGESAFLRGAQAMIRARRPAIILEINLASIAAAGSSLPAFRSQLSDLGYVRFASAARPDHLRDLAGLSPADAGNIVLS